MKTIYINGESTDYKITEDGICYSCKFNKMKQLKPAKLDNGFEMINIYHNKKLYRKLIHVLVAETFIQNPNNYKFVNHINDDNENNNVCNLVWSNDKKILKINN